MTYRCCAAFPPTCMINVCSYFLGRLTELSLAAHIVCLDFFLVILVKFKQIVEHMSAFKKQNYKMGPDDAHIGS